MLRKILSSGVLLLLAPAALTAAASQPVAASAHQPDTSSASLAPRFKTVTRDFSGKPVKLDRNGQVVMIRFKGHQGDLVMLTDSHERYDVVVQAVLRSPSGRRLTSDRPWTRLRTTGWHTYTTGSSLDRDNTRLVLDKVRLVDLERDAAARHLSERPGHLFAVGLKVPKHGLVSGGVTGSGPQALIRPGKRSASFVDPQLLVLGAGIPVVTSYPYGYPRSAALEAGQIFRVLTHGGRAAARRPTRVTGTPDGPLVPIDTSDPARATEIVVNTTPGQWLTTESAEIGSGVHPVVLVGPAGKLVDPTPLRDLWRTAASGGESRFVVIPTRGSASTPVQIGSVTEMPALAQGAAATTYTQAVPGRDFVVPVTGDGYNTIVTTSNVQLPVDWSVMLLKDHVPAYPRGCNGCGEGDLVGADATHPSSTPGSGRWIYVPMPAGGTGKVDLQALTI